MSPGARAGAGVLLTNTLGANRPRFQASSLAAERERVNRPGVQAAREAGGTRCSVAAVIGPIGLYRKGNKLPPRSVSRPSAVARSAGRQGRTCLRRAML